MNQTNKTLKDFTVTELKAIAYETIVQIEQYQLNIKAINQEIASRQVPPTQPEVVTPEVVEAK